MSSISESLVAPISQKSEELRLYNLVQNLTTAALKWYLSIPLLAERFVFFFFGSDDWGFLKKGVKDV